MAWYDEIVGTTKGNVQGLVDALRNPVDTTKQFLKGGEKNRKIASALLQGNTAPLKQAFAEMTPEDLQDAMVNAGVAFAGTIKDVSMPYQKMGINFDLSEYPHKNEISVSRIEIPKEMRNQGIGTQAMQDLINYANQNQQKITLTPSVDFGATSLSRLKQFYKNLGFVENSGKNKDFSTRESMYKLPE